MKQPKQIEITEDVAQILGHYVYAYVDPRNTEVFYVGKGVGSRATSHLNATNESRKVERIREIRNAGLEPRIEIVAHALRDDEEAFRVEASIIELLGMDRLTNEVRGWRSREFRRLLLADLIANWAAVPVEIDDPCLLIRINQRFKYGCSDLELYESTRGIWPIGMRRERVRLAMAVYAGIVREVYAVQSWHRAGATPYETRDASELAKETNRWEFIGEIAPEAIRRKYWGRSVRHYFLKGNRSSVVGIGL